MVFPPPDRLPVGVIAGAKVKRSILRVPRAEFYCCLDLVQRKERAGPTPAPPFPFSITIKTRGGWRIVDACLACW